jgi:hypothetical protein
MEIFAVQFGYGCAARGIAHSTHATKKTETGIQFALAAPKRLKRLD